MPNPLHCTNRECGKLLRADGTELISLSFPDDVNKVKPLLGGNINRARCPACETIIQFDPTVFFYHKPSNQLLVYFPKEVHEDLTEKEKHLAAVKELAADSDISVVEAESLEALTRESRKFVLSSFMQLYNQIATMGIDEWIEANIEKVDFAFLTSFSLIANGHVPVGIAFAADKKLTEQDILEDLRGQLSQLVVHRIMHTGNELLRTKQFWKIDEALSEAIPSCAVTPEQVDKLAKVVERVEKDPSISAIQQYPLEAVLAWTAFRGSIPNPRAKSWAYYFAAAECQLALNDSSEERLGHIHVDDELAKKTISFQDLWDQFARRGNQQKFEEMKVLVQTINRLGFGEQAKDVMSDLVIIDLSNSTSPEKITALKELFISQLGNDQFDPKTTFSILFKNNKPDEAHEVLNASMELNKRAGHLTEATYIVCRFSEIANLYGAYDLALTEVTGWEANLKTDESWSSISVERQVDLLNEIANCFRYKGRFAEALQKYREALELCSTSNSVSELNKQPAQSDELSASRRVLWRNIAIVYRYQGRLEEGMRLLQLVANEAESPFSRAQAYHSIGVNCLLSGDPESAIDSFRTALEYMSSKNPEVFAQQRFVTLLSLGSALLSLKDKSAALNVLASAFQVANDVLNNVTLAAITAGIIASHNLGDHVPDYRNFVRTTYATLQDLLKTSGDLNADQRASLLLTIASCAIDLEDHEGLLALRSQFDALPEGAVYGQLWKFYSYLAASANKRDEFQEARSYIQRAWMELIKSKAQHDLGFDQSGLMLDAEVLQADTAEFFLNAFEKGKVEASYLVLAAEFQASVLQNLAYLDQHSLKLHYQQRPASADWVSEDLKYLQTTGSSEQPLAVIQFLRVSGFDRIVVSIHEKGKLKCHLLSTKLTRDNIRRSWEEFRFKVEVFNPADETNLFEGLSSWTDLTSEFATELRRLVPAGSHLCILPSYTFSGLPLHLASSSDPDEPLFLDYTFSYSPSLFIAARLRERGLKKKSAVAGRLSKLSDFVVWQIGDRKEIIDIFERESDKFGSMAEHYGSEIRSRRGKEATEEAFLDLLGWSECFRISCHGFADALDGKHRFLISDGINLPPTDLKALKSPSSKSFFLDWDQIKSHQSPPIVVSCACSSGAVSLGYGAERIGFERVLFRLGTNSFIAPLWDVPVADIQPILNRTLDIYLGNREFSIAQALHLAQREAFDSGRPVHIVGSLVVHGDWI